MTDQITEPLTIGKRPSPNQKSERYRVYNHTHKQAGTNKPYRDARGRWYYHDGNSLRRIKDRDHIAILDQQVEIARTKAIKDHIESGKAGE